MNPHYHTLSLHYPNLPKYLLDSTDLYHFMTFYDMFNLFIACHSRLPWPAIFCCPSHPITAESRRQATAPSRKSWCCSRKGEPPTETRICTRLLHPQVEQVILERGTWATWDLGPIAMTWWLCWKHDDFPSKTMGNRTVSLGGPVLYDEIPSMFR